MVNLSEEGMEKIRQSIFNANSVSKLEKYITNLKQWMSDKLPQDQQKQVLSMIEKCLKEHPKFEDLAGIREVGETVKRKTIIDNANIHAYEGIGPDGKRKAVIEKKPGYTIGAKKQPAPGTLDQIIPETIHVEESSELVVEESTGQDAFGHTSSGLENIETFDREVPLEQRIAEEDSSEVRITGKGPVDPFLDKIAEKQPKKDPIIGEKISVYKITKRLGKGGMATVYEGRDVNTNRPVAIKTVPKESSPESIQRFKRETQAIIGLDNNHIVHIEQFGERDGLPFYIMENLEGELPDKARDLEQAIDIIYDASCGLEAAHNTESFVYTDSNGRKKKIEIPGGIIHRDIKPDNIRIATDDSVKVTDWGLVELKGAEVTKLSQTGMIMGTPRYMSPEQIIGQDLDAKTDVFSLGLVFYELLTGTLPWDLKNKDVKEIQLFHYQKLLKYDKESLEQARPSSVRQKGLDKIKIPDTIDDLVYLMLQPDKTKRPNMTQVLDILEIFKKNPAQRSMLLEKKLDQAYTYIKDLEREQTKGKRWKCYALGIGAAALISLGLAVYGLSESSEERMKKEGMAKYQPIVALYQDALNDKNPESSLAKLIILAEQTKKFREEHPNIERESIEDILSTAGQKIPDLTKTVQFNKLNKEAQAKYASAKRLVQIAFKEENSGKLEKALATYKTSTQVLEELPKQYIGINFAGMQALLEMLGTRSEKLIQKVFVQKYDSQISTIQEKFIDEQKYEDARISLEKLLAEFRKESRQLPAVERRIRGALANVKSKLSNISESEAYAPLQKQYDLALSTEKAHKLIDAKTLYEKLITDCTEAGDFSKIKELLAKIKTRPEQLHKKILDYANAGDFAKLDQSHKDIVEYTIDSMKQKYGEDPRKITPARELSATDLEERIKHHEVILKEMCRWKGTQMVKSREGENEALFPRYTSGREWGCDNILKRSHIESALYANLLEKLYQITDDKVFSDELKRVRKLITQVKSKELENPNDIDTFPTLLANIFDSENETHKKKALKLMEEYLTYITKDGLFKYSSGEKAYMHEKKLNGLLKAFEYSGNKDFLTAIDRFMKTSLRHHYDSRNRVVYFRIEKNGAIKPTHKVPSSETQISGIFAYLTWYNTIKDKKFLNAAQNIADNYIEWAKQNTDDLVPPYWMTQKDETKKNSKNVKAIEAFLELASITNEKRYTEFAQQIAHSYASSKYLNISQERQGLLLHSIINDEIIDISSTDADLYFLKSFQKLINYEKHQLQLKQKQEEKQEEKQPEQEKQGSMHESFFKRNYCRAPRIMKPANIFKPAKYMIPRRVAI